MLEAIFQYFGSIFLALPLKFCQSRCSSAFSARHQDDIGTDPQTSGAKMQERERERERNRNRNRKRERERN
jgi:hypothetical protein